MICRLTLLPVHCILAIADMVSQSPKENNKKQQRWMRDTEVAELLGMGPWTLRFWRTKGIGPKFFRIGRNIRYRLSDVEVWLENHTGGEQLPPGAAGGAARLEA